MSSSPYHPFIDLLRNADDGNSGFGSFEFMLIVVYTRLLYANNELYMLFALLVVLKQYNDDGVDIDNNNVNLHLLWWCFSDTCHHCHYNHHAMPSHCPRIVTPFKMSWYLRFRSKVKRANCTMKCCSMRMKKKERPFSVRNWKWKVPFWASACSRSMNAPIYLSAI